MSMRGRNVDKFCFSHFVRYAKSALSIKRPHGTDGNTWHSTAHTRTHTHTHTPVQWLTKDAAASGFVTKADSLVWGTGTGRGRGTAAWMHFVLATLPTSLSLSLLPPTLPVAVTETENCNGSKCQRWFAYKATATEPSYCCCCCFCLLQLLLWLLLLLFLVLLLPLRVRLIIICQAALQRAVGRARVPSAGAAAAWQMDRLVDRRTAWLWADKSAVCSAAICKSAALSLSAEGF